MKNDHLPLIRALGKKAKPANLPDLPTFESPRVFEIKHHEITGIAGRRVGEKVSVHLRGHIHSQHNDGRTVMHVSSIKPDSDEMKDKQYPEQSAEPSAE